MLDKYNCTFYETQWTWCYNGQIQEMKKSLLYNGMNLHYKKPQYLKSEQNNNVFKRNIVFFIRNVNKELSLNIGWV